MALFNILLNWFSQISDHHLQIFKFKAFHYQIVINQISSHWTIFLIFLGIHSIYYPILIFPNQFPLILPPNWSSNRPAKLNTFQLAQHHSFSPLMDHKTINLQLVNAISLFFSVTNIVFSTTFSLIIHHKIPITVIYNPP